MKSLILAVLIVNLFSCASCQSFSNSFKTANEIIQKKGNDVATDEKLIPSGIKEDKVVFTKENYNENPLFYILNENTGEYIFDSINVNDENSKIIKAIRFNDVFLFNGYANLSNKYKGVSLFDIPANEIEYQDLWIQKNGENYKLDRFPYYFLDKYYDCSFSDDGKYVICSPYNSSSPGYENEEDGFVYIYNIENVNDIKKTLLNCERCIKSFVVNDSIIFAKEQPIGKGFDGFYTNIFKAPLNDINTKTLLAYHTDLLLVSYEGAYLLGRKKLYGKPDTKIIIEVASNRYQYLLGRDYPAGYCFYARDKKMFGFDLGNQLIYLQNPEYYPFDALKDNGLEKSTSEQENAFWQKFKK